MTAKPTISIVVPCYNGAAYLQQSIGSALDQSYAPLEIIVVDDGSTDSSAEIAGSFGPPVRVICQTNQGESAARNHGIAVALGDYLLFLDADDLLDRSALETLANCVARDSGSVALMGCAWFEHDPANPFAKRMPSATTFFPHIIQGNLGPIHCWLVPRELVLRVGSFNPSIQQFEDWDLWCQIALTGAPLVTVPYVGAYYRRHNVCQSVTSPSVERCRGHAAVIQRLGDGIVWNRYLMRRYGVSLFWSTWTALHRGRLSGMSWKELEGLADNLLELARRGPDDLRKVRFARLIRLCGVRCAETIRGIYSNDAAVTLPAPSAPPDRVAVNT
jgi:glycosyltransferase involved in cell wall biosynthesis